MTKQKDDLSTLLIKPQIKSDDYFVKIPWDSKALGMDAYEIEKVSKNAFEAAIKTPGHYTVRVDPLYPKKILHEYGFYYCDTLIEPYCTYDRFIYFGDENVNASREVDIRLLADISNYAFFYGRFHRDFNIENRLAELRYTEWLRQLCYEHNVFKLLFKNELIGFFGYRNNRIVLHAIKKTHRGKGISKYLWAAACKELFNMGHGELVSCISSANLPAVNLYISLGFKFRNSVDVYHRLVR